MRLYKMKLGNHYQVEGRVNGHVELCLTTSDKELFDKILGLLYYEKRNAS